MFFIVFLLIITGCTHPTGMVVEEQKLTENTNSKPLVFFCPRDNCTQILYSFLNEAQVSIHCALYDLDLPRIIDLLHDRSQAIDVKLITDSDNYENIENLGSVKQDNRSALMHNKFCIIDSKKVFTGSFNPTENGAYKNNNNMVIIESKYLAGNYESEFDEMWEGDFGRGEKVITPVFYLNGHRIENYFCPEDDCAYHVQQELRKANETIYFMAFSFTHDKIANEMVLKHYEGVDVRGVFEKTRISNYSKYHLLEYQGIDVKMDNNKYVMHHKVWIIDNRTVITGSFNPSASADERNDENIVIIEGPILAVEFLQEFKQAQITH